MLACIELSVFDYDKYETACRNNSIFWYVWKPSPDSDGLRYDRYVVGNISSERAKNLTALYAWANRTDPGSVIRYAAMKRQWLDSQRKLQCEKLPMNTPCLL